MSQTLSKARKDVDRTSQIQTLKTLKTIKPQKDKRNNHSFCLALLQYFLGCQISAALEGGNAVSSRGLFGIPCWHTGDSQLVK